MKCFLFQALFSVLFVVGSPAPEATAASNPNRILQRYAGLYQGRWVRPVVFRTTTGAEINTWRSLPLKLRLPARRARTVSRTDMRPIRNDNPRFVDLIGRFQPPRIRRSGRVVVYRARALWLIGTAGLDEENLRGRLRVRVVKRGSRMIANAGNLTVRGNGAGISGDIRARK